MAGPEHYGSGPIVVCDYNAAWPVEFEEERVRVADALGSVALSIEHVGSTAVPGLAAKPIIDLLVTVDDLDRSRRTCIERLRALGYTYLQEYEAWLPGEMLFRKALAGPWTHHLHVMEPDSARWEELVLVRDYLRLHPEYAKAYGALKRALALVFEDDIAGYRGAKQPFLQAILARARAERPQTGGNGNSA
jgi:GrpB-like predicted nucleotidyltransferase (UPF0157 family)